jgi:YjbE family integral membrane protein
MDGAAAAASLGVIVQIIFLDLLLSGDNVLVIALACRHLPPEQARRAAWAGAAGAISLRVFLTLMASELMTLPFVQLLSAFPLLVIALNLMNGEDEGEAPAGSARSEANMLAAVGIIIVSDATMSVDNMVAVAAVSGASFWLLLFGLALSIPLIVFGSFGFSVLMRAFPWLVDAGAGLLGWVAGGMIAHDPLFAGWIDAQAPALAVVLPLACAIFVLVQGRFSREEARRHGAGAPKAPPRRIEAPPRPKAPPKPKPAPQPKSGATPVAVSRENVQASAPDENAERPDVIPAFGPGRAISADDRLIALGLIGLFLIFGLFLLVFLLVPD